MKKAIYLVALTFAMAGCTNTKAPSEQTTNDQNSEPATSFFDTHWQLAELDGKPVMVDSTFNQEPYVIFNESEHRVAGKAGCNGFGGLLELEGQNGIKITQIGATQMACPNLELEYNFLEALKNASSYKITGDTLILSSAQMSSLAKFGKVAR